MIVCETEGYLEPKALSAGELDLLHAGLGANKRAADRIGGVMGFVRDRLNGTSTGPQASGNTAQESQAEMTGESRNGLR